MIKQVYIFLPSIFNFSPKNKQIPNFKKPQFLSFKFVPNNIWGVNRPSFKTTTIYNAPFFLL